MRVLLIGAANTITGGGERHIADLARGLSARGIAVGLGAPAGGDMAELAQILGIPYFEIDATLRAANPAIRRAIKDFKPDIVHAHGSRVAYFARQADDLGARRCVVTFHGLQGAHGFTSKAKLMMERSVQKNTAHFITVCRANRDEAEELGILDRAKTTIIYNGVALPDIATLGYYRGLRHLSNLIGVDPAYPVLLHIGRICAEKDQPSLLHAFAWLRAKEPNAQLAMIATGDEGDLAKLQKLAHKLGIEDAVHFLDAHEDPLPLYASCDLFVLPSIWEGLPYTIIEAMASGAIVVASDVDGIGEAIVNEVTGLLSPPKDPERLAEILEDALDMTETQRKQMREDARAGIIQRFMLDDMINNTISVYDKVMQARTGAQLRR
ncbi:MAG: glycosyltransferase family 4 protein [Actinomycetia bacterium]|nr:glycosyltransferase family 4 protein [Actinomycetes bacterium]